MELTNEFTVDVGIEDAWAILTDVERIAPCMPGAQLQEVEGDEYRGVVRVKVGPITAEYKGKATFVELDPVAHKAVLRAEGRETRGQGNASAIITASLEPAGSATRVQVATDLTISGRVAQFGRGVMADVTAKLLGQFVDSLESTVVAGLHAGPGATPTGSDAADDHAGSPTDAAVRPASGQAGPAEAAAPVDLMGVAGPALARRLVPLLAVVGLVVLWRKVFRRRKA